MSDHLEVVEKKSQGLSVEKSVVRPMAEHKKRSDRRQIRGQRFYILPDNEDIQQE